MNIKSKKEYEDKYVEFDIDTFGNEIYSHLHIKGENKNSEGVSILPMTKNEEIYLIKIFRHAVRNYVFEIPRGGVKEGEKKKDAVKRELKEETNIDAAVIEKLGKISPEDARIDNVFDIYVAKKLRVDDIKPQKSENIKKVVKFKFEDILKMIDNNEIIDSFTINAICRYMIKKRLRSD